MSSHPEIGVFWQVDTSRGRAQLAALDAPEDRARLIAQAEELARTTPHSFSTIRSLQEDLMSPRDDDHDGNPLSAAQALEAVPAILDAAAIGMRGAGQAVRIALAADDQETSP